MIIYINLLIALIGMLMYLLCTNPKLGYIGLVAFGCGLLSFLLGVSSSAVQVLRH